jgi:dTDP-4-amino-4,6-dideoxygalactose transaminase
MDIPFVDLTSSKREEKEFLHLFKIILKQGNYILGEEVSLFEKNFSKYIETQYCIGVASGSDALLLSLKALGIKQGDEVIIPAMTFFATASSIIHAGAKPIFVDIMPSLPLIDPQKIETKITKRTKAIIPVHLYGYPCDMKTINKIAKKHHLSLIEDACQSHGSIYYKKRTGSLSDIGVFSFYPSKNLGAFGDGGAITTSNKNVFEKITALRNHGQKRKNIHQTIGYNSRLDTIQAAILNHKLKSFDKQNLKRRKRAELYTKLLQNLPITLLQEEINTQTNYHIYGIQLTKRDTLFTYLKKKQINCGIHYPIPLHLQPAFAYLGYKKGDFPNAETFAKQILSLPMYPTLTNKQIHDICKQITIFFYE